MQPVLKQEHLLRTICGSTLPGLYDTIWRAGVLQPSDQRIYALCITIVNVSIVARPKLRPDLITLELRGGISTRCALLVQAAQPVLYQAPALAENRIGLRSF